MRNVIIGCGAAGISAAETIRRLDKEAEIIMISDEQNPLYSRPLISYYLAGKMSEDEICYRPAEFFKENKIEVYLGTKVSSINPKRGKISLEDGQKISYDNLLIATGSSPQFPEIPGIHKKGVFGFRTLQDAKDILQMLPQVKQAVVLGGGLVGLKAATGLAARGIEVTVVVGSPHILSQMMDAGAAQVYEELFKEHNIRIATNMREAEVLGNETVSGIRMATGEEYPCQLLIVGKGVNANVELAKDAGIETDFGVLVDERCRTNIENIYAAGDVAQATDVIREEKWANALWPCATEQGRIAALNMMGIETVYDGSMGMNSVQFLDLPVISAGLVGLREKNYDEEIVKRPDRWIYKRLVLKNNKIVGFVLIGDITNAGVIRALMAKGADVSAIKHEILKSSFNFAKILPIIESNAKFTEREYQELREMMRV